MEHRHNGSLPEDDTSGESSTDSRREFLKKVALTGATVAPAVALLMATGSKPAAADIYGDDDCNPPGGGCGCCE